MTRLVTLLLLVAAPHWPALAQSGLPSGDMFTASLDTADGPVTQRATLCRPAQLGLATLVVIAHGTPPAASRPTMQLGRCGSETAQWFVRRGFAVVFFLRPGYGVTGGSWLESDGKCSTADFIRAGQETARAIDAAVDAATALPGVRPAGAVVIGQSAGGWGALAYDAMPHPKVAAIVSMAGGRGGHLHEQPGLTCHPEHLAEAAARFGKTAATPMLWIYTSNDSYFAPPVAASLHQAFTAAGGQADLHQIGDYGQDGHRLFFGPGGSAVWGPLVAGYLAQVLHEPS